MEMRLLRGDHRSSHSKQPEKQEAVGRYSAISPDEDDLRPDRALLRPFVPAELTAPAYPDYYPIENPSSVRGAFMNSSTLEAIQEIYQLWKPVYPHLARHILEYVDRPAAEVLEIGPFCGVGFELKRIKPEASVCFAVFPGEMAEFFRKEAAAQCGKDSVAVIETDPSLAGIKEGSADVAIFRGAFFFPSLFEADLSRIYRILRPGGFAFVGGGFGRLTPESVIRPIGKRSRELNLAIGKVEIEKQDLKRKMDALPEKKGGIELLTEGGIWVLIRK
jgi:hypothetical protein